MSPERSPFRPDLEGVRGVAILLVVLFHAGEARLAGGFVGVDVFFVLSGYFITVMLLREHAGTGGVNVAEFYGRRALRLLPALLLVLLATLAAVSWLYAPIDRAPIAESGRAVALYAANVEFARGAVDYFAAGENPLLHTWALAVEEQFYLVWPLLFLLVAMRSPRRAAALDVDDALATRPVLTGCATIGALSFVASLWLTSASPPWAFFGLPTRLWEFALGGALAVALRHDAARAGARGTLLQVAGLAAIAWATLTYDRGTPYPDVAALLPAAAAAALVVGGQWAPAGIVSRALSMAPLRWLGRLSFAWYLWHWPLVGVGAVLEPRIGTVGRLGWSALALALAWLTHRFVEQPAREGRLSRMPAHWLAQAGLAASLAATLVAHGALRAAERAAARPEQARFAAAREDRMTHDCWATAVEDAVSPCELGDLHAATTLVLLGDSHAEHWLGALDRAGRERGWKIVAMVKGGCPVADVPEMTNARRRRYYRECARYREAMLRRVVAMRPTAVVLSSWDGYLPRDREPSAWQITPEGWERGLRRTYGRLARAGLPVAVVRGTPRAGFDVPSCLSRRAAGLPFASACEYERAASLSRAGVAAQDAAVRGLRGVRFVDMNDQICTTPRCGVVRNGVIVFTDDNHLTASFSRSVGAVFGERLAAALSELGVRLS